MCCTAQSSPITSLPCLPCLSWLHWPDVIRLCHAVLAVLLQRLTCVFHPGVLLVLGDLLAFTRQLLPPASTSPDTAVSATTAAASAAAMPGMRPVTNIAQAGHALVRAARQSSSGTLPDEPPAAARPPSLSSLALGVTADMVAQRRAVEAAASALRQAPSVEDQMALRAPVTTRVPRRYMIHNLTGATIYYWASPPTANGPDGSGGGAEDARHRDYGRHFVLRPGASEKLKLEPSSQARGVEQMTGRRPNQHDPHTLPPPQVCRLVGEVDVLLVGISFSLPAPAPRSLASPLRLLRRRPCRCAAWRATAACSLSDFVPFPLPSPNTSTRASCPTPVTRTLFFLQVCSLVGDGGVLFTSYSSSTINIKFEGLWAPVTEIIVDVVGKYVYKLTSPGGDVNVPLIVDVDLVGRTKVWRDCRV
eukprot:356310-Chlamydomonas_euryale.AAC.4